ncbi:MAG: hypothetical protein EZS28_000756 [Streblomastix strix]|uniref:Serine-threonine/tyrosine-protein kinase catalytic domain-containing protein n=1 Tax=Streblomastix strix TaxID=222440 RepID=A0A5J4X9F8_9EUKA|nr:MAG: hypothetical protein EZS28_000756 [Streblomastix strix]
MAFCSKLGFFTKYRKYSSQLTMINKNDLNSPILVGELIGINFVVERIQAAGHNYTIYSAKLQGNQQAVSVALKVAKDEFVTIAITNENHVIGSIQNTKHFAKIFESGRHRQFNYIVTQMLGPNLRDLALNHPSFTFSLKTLLKFAYQAIDSLQSLHQAGFVHGSVIAVWIAIII